MHYSIERIDINAPWILFIHGLGGSSKTWKYQDGAFDGYNVLRVDLRGHGKSALEKVSNHPVKQAVNDIIQIMNNEHIDKVNIVSLSLGTIVALEMSLKYTSRVETMVLAGCVVNLSWAKRMLLCFVEVLKYVIPIHWLYCLFARIIMPRTIHKKSREIFVRESKKMKTFAFQKWIDALLVSPERVSEYVKNIKMNKLPVLFVTGKEDYLFIDGVKNMQHKLRNSNIELLDKCGHVCSIDKSSDFNKLVNKFLHKRKYYQLS